MWEVEQGGERPRLGQQSAYWCQYLCNFQHQRLRDRTLTTIIKEILFYKEPLQVLLTKVHSGRRVFKQQCLKREIPYSVFPILVDIGEADLAFNVVLSHAVWKDVVELCANQDVTRKSRDTALKKAVQQGRWEEVVQMVDKAPSPKAFSGRRVFQEMVRWGKLPQAAQILKKGVSVTDGDLNFAIRACLRLEQLDCVFQFVEKMESLDRNRSLLAQVAKASIPSGKLDCFMEVIRNKSNRFFTKTLLPTTKFLKTLFKVLFRLQQSEFVTTFCQAQEEPWIWVCCDTWAVANQAAIETCQWHAVNGDRLDLKEFGMCLETCLKSKKQAERRTICQLLEDWCSQEDNFDDFDGSNVHVLSREIKPILLNTRSRWLGWCSASGFYNLGFVLALAAGNPKKLTRYLEQHGSSVKKFLLAQSLETVNELDSDNVGEVLRHLSAEDVEVWDMCDNFGAETLIKTCAEKGLTEWTILLAVYAEDWERIESKINEPEGIPVSLVDHVIVRASEADEWRIVQILLMKHSLSPSVLFAVLRIAISTEDTENAVDVARNILEKVDPKLAGQHWFFNRTLLSAAVQCSSDREQMVRLCISTGVSTFEPWCFRSLPFGKDTAMSTALWNGQLPLVKLLYLSGATTNEELHQLNCDQSLKTRLSGQGREDIVRYLREVASTPRSLQDLCRLRVSHLIGCHPDREKRLELLPLPSIVKDLVRFKPE